MTTFVLSFVFIKTSGVVWKNFEMKYTAYITDFSAPNWQKCVYSGSLQLRTAKKQFVWKMKKMIPWANVNVCVRVGGFDLNYFV